MENLFVGYDGPESFGDSVYKIHANKVLKWCPTDNESRWIDNSRNPKTKRILDEYGWTENSIEYSFNSHGFRADEFEGDGAMFLGCSFTMGIGMDLERTWTYLVAKELGLKHWNLGQSGRSNDTCFRLADYWIPKIKPKLVCLLPPPMRRVEVISMDSIIAHIQNLPESLRERMYTDWLSNDINSVLNTKKNAMAIWYICNQHNIPLYVISHDHLDSAHAKYGYARDLAHPGAKWHSLMAKNFIELIKG